MEADRSISAREIAVVTWLLEHAPVEGRYPHLLDGVPRLRVVARCDCGCASVDFERGGQSAARAWILADAVGKSPAGLSCGLILWGRDDAVTGLEIYGGAPGSADELPALDSLRPW
jgi:hypothetical protein